MSAVRIEYANGSDIGKVRSENQDFFGTYEVGGGYLFIVCDGMGGHEGGSEASRIAVNAIKEYFISNFEKEESVEKLLEKSILFANGEILKVSQERQYSRGMGTTVVAVYIKDDKMFYAHVGDSRIYLIRDNKIIYLTEDHTLVHQLVKMGKLTEEEAEMHPARHQLLQALGISEDVFVEISKEPIRLKNNDYILLCSDGLHGYVKEETIKNIITNEELTIMQKVEKLIQAALDAGGYDNVTVQLIKVIGTPEPTPEQKNSKKNIILASTGIIALLMILTALYFLTKKDSNKDTDKAPEEQIVAVDTAKTETLDSTIYSETQDSLDTKELQDTTTEEKILKDIKNNQKKRENADSIKKEGPETQESKIKPNEHNTKQEKNDNILTINYKVRKNENLTTIANKFCINKSELKALNKIENEDNIQAGQTLKIPVQKKHKVKKGEVLSKIAEKYKVSLKKIKEINNLPDENIQVGNTLIIPKCER